MSKCNKCGRDRQYAVQMRGALAELVGLDAIVREYGSGSDYYKQSELKAWARAGAALAKNPNPSGHVPAEASVAYTSEASGPVGLGPDNVLTVGLHHCACLFDDTHQVETCKYHGFIGGSHKESGTPRTVASHTQEKT